MPIEWDISEFASLVNSKIGRPHEKAMLPALESIPEKFRFCQYHHSRAIELMAPHKTESRDRLAQTAAAMQMMFSQSEEERRCFVEALFGARAHAIAFAQSLHSTADYLAKVIYRGLDLAGRYRINIQEHRIGLGKVKDSISSITELSSVEQRIQEYLTSNAFIYLAAFVNTEKHHEIVDATFSLSISVGSVASAGLRMNPFQYSGSNFPEKWAIDFFEKDFQTILQQTASIGSALNTYLRLL